jgi:glycosyltransferase involved in cell wall biosynthesis
MRDHLVVGWLGRNSSEKRPDLLMEVAQVTPDVQFVVAGAGFANMESALPNVTFQGHVSDLGQFFSSVDLLINTSDVEGISLSAMEALQRGVPVATRDVGGMSELIQDGYNGFLYDAGDMRALSARISDTAQLEAVRKVARESLLPPKFHETAMLEVMRRAILKKVWQ